MSWFKKNKSMNYIIKLVIPVINFPTLGFILWYDMSIQDSSRTARKQKKNLLFLSHRHSQQSEVGCDYYHGWESWSSVCATCTIFMIYAAAYLLHTSLFRYTISNFLPENSILYYANDEQNLNWPGSYEPMQHWRCWFGNSCLRCCMFTLHSSSR
jgi:hypothetical protein